MGQLLPKLSKNLQETPAIDIHETPAIDIVGGQGMCCPVNLAKFFRTFLQNTSERVFEHEQIIQHLRSQKL